MNNTNEIEVNLALHRPLDLIQSIFEKYWTTSKDPYNDWGVPKYFEDLLQAHWDKVFSIRLII